MAAAFALPDLQRRFLAALYDDGDPGPVEAIAGNGLAPAARLRIYRHSCDAIQTGALRTAYPAVLALVGEDYFEQAAHGYRLAHPSRSGNLQAFGARFGDHLESLPETHALTYLGDVARLEWLRQRAALAPDAETLDAAICEQRMHTAHGKARIRFHPSVRLFASRHAVLAIWQFAMHPSGERFVLPEHGENVVLWRAGGEVAMAVLDDASHVCLETLARGATLNIADTVARTKDPAFDLRACIISFVAQGLVTAITSVQSEDTPA